MPPANPYAGSPPSSGVDCAKYNFEVFAQTLAARSDAPAIIYFDHKISYGQLDRASRALAVWLWNKNVRRGDRVCIVTQNVPHYVAALLAIWKCGAIAMPCNPMYTEAELAKLFEDAAPSAAFSERGSLAHLEAALRCLGHQVPIATIDPQDFRRADGDPAALPVNSDNDVLKIVRAWSGDLDRLKCIQAVVDGDLKPIRAADRLGLTTRQVRSSRS